MNRVLIENRWRLFIRTYKISEDSDKFLLDNTASGGDLQNAVLKVDNDGTADADSENVDEREEALRLRIIMSRAVDKCSASLKATLVRHFMIYSILFIHIDVLNPGTIKQSS